MIKKAKLTTSKLIKNARKYFDKPILTWSDNRWSNGNVYKKIGCKRLDDVRPDYYWTDFCKLYSKQSRAKNVTGQPKEITEKDHEWKDEELYPEVDQELSCC